MKRLNQIDKAFVLKKTFLFEDLNLEQLFALASKIESHSLDKGEYIFKDNQSALHIYIIASGSIHLLNPKGELLTHLREGDIFGDEALLNDQTHQYQAKSAEKSHLLALTKKSLSTIISECPSVALNLLEAFARHIPFRHGVC